MAEPKKPVKKAAPVAKKAAAKPAAKAAPVKKAVARPVTRAVKKAAAPERPQPKREPRPRVMVKLLPTAPVGEVPLIAADGSVAGSLALPASLMRTANQGLVFQAILTSQANARQATAATKSRSRVSGGGAKPWAQKGTGRARQGSTRSPIWRHGGVVFGPNGRVYDQRMPRRMRRAALGSSLAERAVEGRVLVLEALSLPGERKRSRDLIEWLAKVGEVRRVLIVLDEMDEGIGRAAANVRAIEVRTPVTLGLLDIMRADTILVVRAALDALAARADITARERDGEAA